MYITHMMKWKSLILFRNRASYWKINSYRIFFCDRNVKYVKFYKNFSIFIIHFLWRSLSLFVFNNNCLTKRNMVKRGAAAHNRRHIREREKEWKNNMFNIPFHLLRIDKHCISSTWSLFIICHVWMRKNDDECDFLCFHHQFKQFSSVEKHETSSLFCRRKIEGKEKDFPHDIRY